MTEEMKIEELLNSYVDGELTVRERTQVKRMAANDPNIARRLRQIQKCRTLVSALPVTDAPSQLLENIKEKLESKNLTEQGHTVSISDYKEEKSGMFLSRRVFAAAAMISIAAVLVFVFNMFISPGVTPGTGNPGVVAKVSGRLELKANDLQGVQSVISKAIKNNGIPESATPLKDTNRRIYTLNCSREGLNKILNDLEGYWGEISSAKFSLDTENFGERLEVSSITPAQISEIINQENSDQSIKIAKEISITNSVNDILSNKGMLGSGSNSFAGGLKVPRPVIVSEKHLPIQKDNGEKTIQLRIVLSR